MSGETEHVTEADCVLCHDLNADQRIVMRADLIVIPLREPVCDGCMEALTANLFAGFPKTRRRRCGGRRRWHVAENREIYNG